MDIRIYTTSPLDECDPTLASIIKDYWKRIDSKNKTLEKFSNPDDLEHYKSGQIIKEISSVINLKDKDKIAGQEVNPGDILILFYIKYPLAASKGDKVVCSVCKGIVSHVFDEGLEPYSEYRPVEPIDTIVAPLAVSARKVPNIFLTIFTNKVLIELKHQLREIYES